jgi:hypothetical protein
VTEEDPSRLGYVREKKIPATPVRASSPFLLSDQELRSRITVRAFDQAGNRSEFIIDPSSQPIPQQAASGTTSEAVIWSIIGVVIVVFSMLAGHLIRRRREALHDSSMDDGTI